MTFSKLLSATCNIQAKSTTRVSYEAVLAWTNIATNVPCRKDSSNTPSYIDSQIRVNNEDDLFFFDASVSIAKGNRIFFDGEYFDVIRVNKSYGSAGVHHLEVVARQSDHK